jgi:hypothetical protein
MTPFTEWIKWNNQNIAFNFRKIQSPNQEKFFITGEDSEKNPIAFDVILNEDKKWIIVQPAPESILQIKEQFVSLIKKHTQNVTSQ